MNSYISKNQYLFVIVILLLALDSLSCKSLHNKFRSLADDDEIITITEDDDSLLQLALEELKKTGGTIYIDTPIINVKDETELILTGNLPGGIIGIRQPNGEYPIIHFEKTDILKIDGGFLIEGSNKFIEYIIVENSISYGIIIFGDNNILDHVVSRYNYFSGFIVFGDFNSFNYCYSYRNCDASINYVDADGFEILGEQNNVFNYCFAWDNSNNGFNYIRILNSSDLSYLHSGSWNNGNINVFTGKYDYDNGAPLDKNMWSIQAIIESDPNFVSNYYNKKYSISNAKIEDISVSTWIAKVSPKMEGNGFTFGNQNSSQSIDVKRNSLYNVAFDHKSGGFVDNFNHKYNAYITNCVSFNNDINYRLPYTFSKWENNWSWGSKNKDQINGGITAEKPSNTNSAQRAFYTTREQIIKAVYANMFPDGVNFDRIINSLK